MPITAWWPACSVTWPSIPRWPSRETPSCRPGGLRLGTIEVTRLGMGPEEMETIADFMAAVLVERREPEEMGRQVVDFRRPFQTLRYCFT
jgi:glycine/serine hydroxymethyltransferase